MLRITDRAIEHLERLRSERGYDAQVGARFVKNGPRLGLTFASGPLKGDQVVPRGRLAVYLAAEAAATFQHAIIDAKTRRDRTWLVVRSRRSDAPADIGQA